MRRSEKERVCEKERESKKEREREKERKKERESKSGEPGQLRESLRHVTLPRQRLAFASVRISRSWVQTPGVSDVRSVRRRILGLARCLQGAADAVRRVDCLRVGDPGPPRATTEAMMRGQHYVRLKRLPGAPTVCSGLRQVEFQQSKSYEKLEVPQLQLIVGVVDFPVVAETGTHSVPGAVPGGRRHALCCATTGAFSRVVSTRSWRRGQIPTVPSVSEDRGDSQLQSIDKVSLSSLCRSYRFSEACRGEDRRLPLLQIVEKILEIRQFMDKVVARPLACNNRCSS